MIRRVTAPALLLSVLLLAAPAGAQIITLPRSTEPTVWAAAGIALFQIQGVVDGRTNSLWALGGSNTAQYRASLEKGISNQSSIGLTGTYARVPFRYARRSLDAPVPDPDNACGACDARMDISSLGISFHAGGGVGLHQVIQAQAGVTRFANFRSDDGQRLAPLSGDTDLSFTLAYGFGYAVSPRFQVSVVQDFGFVLHQREGLGGNEGGAVQQRITRLNVRYGLGRQRPRV